MTHPLPRQPQPQNISKRRHITMYHATPRLTVQNRWKFGDGPSFKKVSGYEGNFAIVRIGRYCEINTRTALEPPPHPLDTSKWIPLVIGSHTHIGTNCEIQAVAIGSMVWIGHGVRLGPRVIVKDNCIVEDGAHLGAHPLLESRPRIRCGLLSYLPAWPLKCKRFHWIVIMTLNWSKETYNDDAFGAMMSLDAVT